MCRPGGACVVPGMPVERQKSTLEWRSRRRHTVGEAGERVAVLWRCLNSLGASGHPSAGLGRAPQNYMGSHLVRD